MKKILLVISLLCSNTFYPFFYDHLPKHGKRDYFLLRHDKQYELSNEWSDDIYMGSKFRIGTNELLSFMYYDMIEDFKNLKKENIELKKQLTRLESKIDLLLKEADIDVVPQRLINHFY